MLPNPNPLRRCLIWLIVLIGLWAGQGHSAVDSKELAYLMTYGTDAGTVEGDDDFVQVIFIKIPAEWTGPLFIKLFDADCGGRHDELFSGRWNTRTRFRLYGGSEAFFLPDINRLERSHPRFFKGKLLADQTFGQDESYDNRWHSWQSVQPDPNDALGGFVYYKLIVEGLGGNDGNAYLVSAVADPGATVVSQQVDIFSYDPTIRLPRFGIFSEMRFFVPQDVRTLEVFNFDLSGAKIGVDTMFRSNLPVPSSGQNQWLSGTVQLNPNEVGRLCAIRFEGGREMPNDGTFYVADESGRLLPIKLTIYLQEPNLRPTARITVSADKDCRTFLFDASRSLDREGDAMGFEWDFGDGTGGSGQTVTHRYKESGRYQGHVVIQDDAGQIHNSIIQRFTVSVNHPPVALANIQPRGAPGQILTFDATASRDPDGKIIAYHWDFGDGSRISKQRATHAYRQPGTYMVSLRVEDNSGSSCRTDDMSRQVVINAPPIAAVGPDMTVSVGEPIVFSGADSRDPDGRLISYEWNLGDWTRKSGPEVTHAYQTPGTYKATLTVTDDSGAKNSTASARRRIHVNAPPVADAGDDYKGAAGDAIRFDAAASRDPDGRIVSYEWDFGDGHRQKTSEGTPYATHIYRQPGRYRLTLTVSDDSGTRTATAQDVAAVRINHPPVADAGPDLTGMSGDVRFNAAGSHDPDGKIVKYAWDFGDGNTASGISPRHVYQRPGTYLVRLTVTDDSQTASARASDEMRVSVNHLPIADAGQDRIGVPGQPLRFDASSSVDPDGEISDYRWDFGDGTTASGARVNHRYDHPGRYTAFLTVKDNSGYKSAVGYDGISVHINQPPVAVAGADKLVATDQPVIFNAERSYDPDGRIVDYRWEFSDSKFNRNAVKAERSFSEAGIYTATLTVVDDLGVENSMTQDKVTIRVNHAPVADCGKDRITAVRTVLFDGSGSTDADGDVLAYTWDFGDGSPVRHGQRVYHTFAKGGHFPITLTVDDGNDLSNSRTSTSISVKINDPPIAKAGKNRTVCAGKPVIFDGSHSLDPEGGRLKYHWDFGDGTTDGIVNPVKTYKKGGIYLVNLTVTDDSGLTEGATSSDQIAVTVIESPVAEAGPDQTVCAGTPVQFDGSRSRDVDGLVNQFQWHFGEGPIGSGPFPTHTFTRPGVYHVSLTITGDQIGDCVNTDSDQMTVTVEQAPLADFKGPLLAEYGRSLQFDASPSKTGNNPSTQYQWDFGDGTQADGKTVMHTYAKPGKYIVKLVLKTGTESSCNQASKHQQVIINASPVAKVAAPNVKTASGGEFLAAVNQMVIFDGTASEDPDGIISRYDWDFGDGHTAAGAYVNHQYESPGRYRVILRVKDNAGLANSTHTDTLTVNVNDTPKAMIEGSGKVCPNQEVRFSGRGSFDPDGEVRKYTWNFGDGTAVRSGMEAIHAYRHPGKYTVLLEVDDGMGLDNSRSQVATTVEVNQPPQIDAGPDRVVSPGDRVELIATVKGRSEDIATYQWDLGQGQLVYGKRVVHRYEQPGRFRVRLKVEDKSNTRCNTAEDVVTIRVNSPPLAVIESNREAMTGGAHDAVLFDGTASIDPDGDPLSFHWSFGDGHQAMGPKVFHRYTKPGRYVVTLRVDDGRNLTSSVGRQQTTVHVRQR